MLKGVDDPKLKHRMGNTGYYGRGIYFREFTHYSMGYVAGETKILLSKVLPGKVCTSFLSFSLLSLSLLQRFFMFIRFFILRE